MEIGGVGSIQIQINEAVQGLSETNKIVRDIFAELDKFKKEVDEEIRKEALRKITERLEKLRVTVEKAGLSLGRTLGVTLSSIQESVDQARISGLSLTDAQALSRIQQQIDDLRAKLQGLGTI
ncbi:MAG: hypothetical protein ACPL4K_02880 [Candidatus Margulisiibacteriota bacterium]